MAPATAKKKSARLTFEEYQAIDAVNFSTLKEMGRSPRHYLHRLENPPHETASMLLGRATHTAVLEPDRFLLDYALFDGERRAGKVWEAFAAQNAHKTILKRNEYDLCLAIRDAVRSHPSAAAILMRGEPEKTITWTDPDTGLACKARLDWLNAPILLDLKSTSTIDAGIFGATAARIGHHVQMAFYLQGLAAIGIEAKAKIVAVESAAPHDVAIFAVDGNALQAGREECAELLRKVAACREHGNWPGRYPAEQSLSLPRWVLPDEDSSGLGITIGGVEA